MTTRKTTKIDMHIHTPGSDGFGSPDDFVDFARAAKLNGLVITDHHRTYTAQGLDIARALRKAGFLAFHGCEYTTDWGHLLVYGVDVEQFSWGYYPDPRLVIADVRKAGGVCVPAHPYQGYHRTFGDRVKTLKGIAGIEAANGQVAVRSPQTNKRAAQVAKERGLVTFGGSDAHHVSYVGACYTQFQTIIRTEQDLIKAMRQGLAKAVVSQKRVKELVDAAAQRRIKAIHASPVPITALLPGVRLDNGQKTVQVSMDGHRDGIDWWWGDRSTAN